MFRLIAVLTAFSALLATSAPAADKLIYGVFWEGCEHGCQGFVDAIEASSLDAEIILRDARQDKSLLPGFVQEARAMGADLVLTYGTSVTLGIAGRLENAGDDRYITTIPLVFMYVADPFGTHIAESFEGSGRANITGTYNRVPEEVNIETIRAYRPDFRKLGILFNGNEANSVNKVAEMQALSEKMGYELVALEIEPGNAGAPDPAMIATRMPEFAARQVDFMYLGSSSFLRLNGAIYTEAAVENGIPILSPYESLVREQQALLSIAARARDIGSVAAEQALRILRDGATPGDLPIERVTDFAFVINMDVAKQLKLFPPLDLLQIAETVN
jgi:putative ABC transport system substrate-binding protein